MICITLSGPPGSGKSTVGRLLEGLLPAKRFDIVDFYEPETDFSDSTRWVAFLELLSCARRALLAGDMIVVEAFLFRPQRQEALTSLCRETRSGLFTVLLTARLDVLLERVRDRDTEHLRTTVTPADVIRFMDDFKGMTADVIIDTSDKTIPKVATTIQEALTQWRKRV